MRITSLVCYPVKSCKGVEVESAVINERGLEHDRSLMIVDSESQFLTQREYPSIALIEPLFMDGQSLVLKAPGMSELRVTLAAQGDERTVKVWSHYCVAVDQGEDVAQWLTDYLRTPSRLVRTGSAFKRQAPMPGDRTAEVSFADHYPVVIATEESLAYLNERLTKPVRMNRYRANIVLAEGLEAFEEYEWSEIQIGSIAFEIVKVCDRCSITIVDQETGQQCTDSFKALTAFGMKDYNKPVFGIHAAPLNLGVIEITSKVDVTAKGREKLPLAHWH